jgi:hypothetical protein
MTRLETQIEKMQNEINSFIEFSNKQNELFLRDFNSIIVPILNKYKTGVVGPCDNTFVDRLLADKETLMYRVYLKCDLSKLSKLQKKNLEQQLRSKKVPMPICPISSDSITLVYM